MAEPSFTCITSSPLLLKDFAFANILKYTTILNNAHECLNDYTSVIIKGQALFKEQFVTGIGFAEVPIGDSGDGPKEKWLIRAKVKAEMKKTVTYCVTVTIHRNGEVRSKPIMRYRSR
ncbi:hypothetical protein PoB_002834200 [Plakobranchus ocellatus]|uniref:Uncharacterized protein n=1 Tax=Plakobranchus ocellatus TaxID=259542 RepID=A0AAV4A3D9_9GAST|nr:hypothetical protein PoB_002834200 [Plakobranchus ocellatus]